HRPRQRQGQVAPAEPVDVGRHPREERRWAVVYAADERAQAQASGLQGYMHLSSLGAICHPERSEGSATCRMVARCESFGRSSLRMTPPRLGRVETSWTKRPQSSDL